MTERRYSSSSANGNKKPEVQFTGVIDGRPRIRTVGRTTQVRMVVVESGDDVGEKPPWHNVHTTTLIGEQTIAMVRAGTLHAGVEVSIEGYEERKPGSDRGTPPSPTVRATKLQLLS